MIFLLLACTAGEDSPPPDSMLDSESTWEAPEGGEISLRTRDEIALVADYYPSDTQAGGAAILLHMNPSGGYHRGDWPESFITALGEAGLTVLNVDRRGSGDSEGKPRQAYEGETGRYDVEACALRLREDGYDDLVLIGASNGTTSALDYAAWAPGQALPEVFASVYMTGGSYTENQTAMEELPQMPVMFTYSTAERSWSVAQEDLDPGSWQFSEYADGAHGTQMFDAAPQVTQDIVGFLEGALGG